MNPDFRKVQAQDEVEQPGASQVAAPEQQVARQTVPLTQDMATSKLIKPGATLLATQTLQEQTGVTIFTAGTYYKVRGYASNQTAYPGGLLVDSEYPGGKPWIISFAKNGIAPTFQVVQYTPEEQQFLAITETHGELPERILSILKQYQSGLPYQDLQQFLLKDLYHSHKQDMQAITAEITRAFIALRSLSYLTVANNKRVFITSAGQRYLEFK